jgi:hypothetical protein
VTFRSAKSVRKAGVLAVTRKGVYSEVVVPELSDYELVVLQ